jgi:hypothetical protein
LKVSALAGVASVAVLAAGPALAASTVSQASAQSIELSLAGTKVVSQKITATNDGSGEQKNSNDTLPTIASVVPGNNLIGAGVAPQEAGATVDNGDGKSFACAGIAGTGGGIVKVGDSSCALNGKPLTIDLAHLNLGDVVLGSDSALGQALGPILNSIGLGALLNQVVTALSGGLAGTPLGEIKIGGSLSAIEASCTADPDKATGDARLVDSSGGSNATPISITLPGVAQPLVLLNLPANPPPNTHLLVDLDKVTQSLIDGLKAELTTALQGALGALAPVLQTVQDQLLSVLIDNLRDPLLKPLQENLLDVVLNEQSKSADGKTVNVTALHLNLLPVLKQFSGSSLLEGKIGSVSCGPNARIGTPTTPTTPANPGNPSAPHIPKHVDSGLAGNGSNTSVILAATTALLAMAGAASLFAYRRFWMPKA